MNKAIEKLKILRTRNTQGNRKKETEKRLIIEIKFDIIFLGIMYRATM